MNSTPNTKDGLIARADEQIARAYEKIARADEQLARMSERFSKIERGAVHDPSAGAPDEARTPEGSSTEKELTPESKSESLSKAAQPPHGWLARRGLIGLLSAVCIVGIIIVVLRSSHGDVMLIGAQRAPQLISTLPSPSKNPPVAQPDPPAVSAAEAAPPQTAPLSHTGPQDAATAASVTSEVTQLLQKMTGDIANLEQAMEQLKAKQDQIANDNTKAIEELKTKQEDMARLLGKLSEQSALPKTSPPSAGPSPQARIQTQAPPPRRQYPPRWQYSPRWQYYDGEW